VSGLVIPGVNAPRRTRIKLAVILLIAAYVLWIGTYAILNARELQLQSVCAANLKGVAAAFQMYGHEMGVENGNAVEWLVAHGRLELRQTICPSTSLATTNYVMVPISKNSQIKESAIVAFEQKSNHRDGGNVVFSDGHVKFVRGVEYDNLVGERSATSSR